MPMGYYSGLNKGLEAIRNTNPAPHDHGKGKII
jgi:hypothetical protein